VQRKLAVWVRVWIAVGDETRGDEELEWWGYAVNSSRVLLLRFRSGEGILKEVEFVWIFGRRLIAAVD
jgi:hypothetical protein